MRAIIVSAGLCVLLAACATSSTSGGLAPSGAVERGGAFAARECARCHALGPVGDSPRADAPPFHVVRLRHNQISFERRMAEIAAGGHYDMPPLRIAPADVRDVQAYIESLGS